MNPYPCYHPEKSTTHALFISITLWLFNIANWKITMLLIGKPVNHLFLWTIYNMAMINNQMVPSGELTWQWKITIFNGKIHYKWPFSIAMLVHQRVHQLHPSYPICPICPASNAGLRHAAWRWRWCGIARPRRFVKRFSCLVAPPWGQRWGHNLAWYPLKMWVYQVISPSSYVMMSSEYINFEGDITWYTHLTSSSHQQVSRR